MATQGTLMDKIMALPKWLLILFGVIAFCVIGFALVYFGFGLGNKPKSQPMPENVVIEVPEASVENIDESRIEHFDNAKYRRSQNSSSDYWSSLESGEGEQDGLLVSNDKEEGSDYLDPAIYSKYEIYNITHGITTKAAVDAEHEKVKAENEAMMASLPKAMTRAQRDSAQLAMMERSLSLAQQYQEGTGKATSQKPRQGSSSSAKSSETTVTKADESKAQQEERTLPAQKPSRNSSDLSFSEDDGIISSLRDPSDDGVVHYAGKINSKPVKATFLKTGKIISGERVTIRLMDDLKLSNGLTIPANTHITGTCSFNKRLKINVTMLHFNGRMFPVDISVYDNDGTEGIYCPAAGEGEKAGKKAKEVAGDVLSSAGSVFGSVMTGNVFAGRAVESGIRQATSSVRGDGTVEVQVSAGYQFYVFENVKDSN